MDAYFLFGLSEFDILASEELVGKIIECHLANVLVNFHVSKENTGIFFENGEKYNIPPSQFEEILPLILPILGWLPGNHSGRRIGFGARS